MKPPPEAPEVQTIVDGLIEICAGKELLIMEAVGGRYASKLPFGLHPEFPRSSGTLVTNVLRHGKAIVMETSKEESIVVTLGMTGKFSMTKEKHAAIRFQLSGKEFFFVDQRRFGTVRVVSTKQLPKVLPRVGWDALSEEGDTESMLEKLSSAKGVIGSAMLNSGIFSGIGNYLRAEILYETRISPWRQCTELTKEEVERIGAASRRICLRSYELGGNTIENFVAVDGSHGKFSEELKVYGKRRTIDGEEVVAEKTPEGRTMHWVPSAQN